MTQTEQVSHHLVHAVTAHSRRELVVLAHDDALAGLPSDALVDDLSRTLAGHTQIGRCLPLRHVVHGPLPRDPAGTTTSHELPSWIRDHDAA
jgi:hypothetical protein